LRVEECPQIEGDTPSWREKDKDTGTNLHGGEVDKGMRTQHTEYQIVF